MNQANRMIVFVLALLVFTATVHSTVANAAAKPRVTLSPRFDPNVYSRFAIYVEDRTRRRLDSGIMRAIDDEFTRAAIENGYTVASRSDIDAIEKELKIQASDFTEAAMAKRAHALNVSAIILVSINSVDVERYTPVSSLIFKDQRNKRAYRSNISVSARMISAQEAQILWISSFSEYNHVGDRSDYKVAARAVPKVASIVAAGLPSRIAR
jgi:hypothetical protein